MTEYPVNMDVNPYRVGAFDPVTNTISYNCPRSDSTCAIIDSVWISIMPADGSPRTTRTSLMRRG